MSRAHLKLVCSAMPPLRHSPADRIPGSKFDITKSEVVAWLVHQPEAMEWMFSTCQQWLEYDEAAGTWRGKPIEPVDAAGRKSKISIRLMAKAELLRCARKVAPNYDRRQRITRIYQEMVPNLRINLTAIYQIADELVREGQLEKLKRKDEQKFFWIATFPPPPEVEI